MAPFKTEFRNQNGKPLVGNLSPNAAKILARTQFDRPAAPK
jgi:hypothetical protein